jgi:hypothetical protein
VQEHSKKDSRLPRNDEITEEQILDMRDPS